MKADDHKDKDKNKKLTALRVLIYTVITYSLCYGLFAAVGAENMNSLCMFTPITGAVLTMLITREKPASLAELYIPLKLKGQVRYYVYALIGGLAFSLVGGLICALYFGGEYSLAEQLTSEQASEILKLIPYMLCMSVYLIFICLGEEYGWRAYLTPRLEKLMPVWAAVIVQGVIWAMWHKPVLDAGINFGKNAPFFPWLNYAAMTVMCIFIGAALSWLVKKTGSVLPAALAHSAIDLCNPVLSAFIPESVSKNGDNAFIIGVLALLPFSAVIGGICIVLMMKGNKARK